MILTANGCIRLIYRICCLRWTYPYPRQTYASHLKLPLNLIDFVYLACETAFTYPRQSETRDLKLLSNSTDFV
jgi:hypothetical protein